jgi:hypothetical protein
VADDHVEVPVREAEGPAVSGLEGHGALCRSKLVSLGDEHRRRVDPDHLGHRGLTGQHACDGARPAPDLQHPRSRDERDLGEVGVEHGALLWVGSPQLEDVGQTFLRSDVDLGDHGVDIGHGSRSSMTLVRDGTPAWHRVWAANRTEGGVAVVGPSEGEDLLVDGLGLRRRRHAEVTSEGLAASLVGSQGFGAVATAHVEAHEPYVARLPVRVQPQGLVGVAEGVVLVGPVR